MYFTVTIWKLTNDSSCCWHWRKNERKEQTNKHNNKNCWKQNNNHANNVSKIIQIHWKNTTIKMWKNHKNTALDAGILISNCFYFDLKFIFIYSVIRALFCKLTTHKKCCWWVNMVRTMQCQYLYIGMHLPLSLTPMLFKIEFWVSYVKPHQRMMLCYAFQTSHFNAHSWTELNLSFWTLVCVSLCMCVNFNGKSHFDDFFMNAQIVVLVIFFSTFVTFSLSVWSYFFSLLTAYFVFDPNLFATWEKKVDEHIWKFQTNKHGETNSIWFEQQKCLNVMSPKNAAYRQHLFDIIFFVHLAKGFYLWFK